MKITRKSTISGKTNTLEIPCTEQQLESYYNGTLIQNAMPDVPKELREFIITGVTPEEWEETFSGEEF